MDTMSYFDTETQRRTTSIDKIEISPAMEVLFDSPKELISRIEALSKAARGKRTELIRENFAKDIDRLKTGLSLGNIDKYLSAAYEKPASLSSALVRITESIISVLSVPIYIFLFFDI